MEGPIILGIGGGMGMGTSHKFVKEFSAEHPEIQLRYALAHQHGLDHAEEPGYIQEGKFQEHFEEVVVAMFGRLVKEGATHLALICNTAHQHERAIRESLPENVQFLSIIDAVKFQVEQSGISKPLLLATPMTSFQLGLYDSIRGLQKPLKNEQKFLGKFVINILKGIIREEDIDYLVKIILNHEADGLIYGCSDLALVQNQVEEKLEKLERPLISIESTRALKEYLFLQTRR